jgi:hypothetical protein
MDGVPSESRHHHSTEKKVRTLALFADNPNPFKVEILTTKVQ